MSFAKDGNSEVTQWIEKMRTVEKNYQSSINEIHHLSCILQMSTYVSFNSDRSGYQQLYVTTKSDGSVVRRISFGKGISWHSVSIS